MALFDDMLRNEKLEEELERVKQWKLEGKTKEEILLIMDKRILIEQDIESIFNEEKNFIEDKVEQNNLSINNVKGVKYLKDEDLLDYENQPFINDNKDENLELEESIKLNGIIQPIVVRPYKGKYQILSGHRRRMCGRNIGLKEFPCFVHEKSDNEAKIYLVDTNLVSRKVIRPTERARAYLMRKEALENAKATNDNFYLREKLISENNSSNGSIQRYLRINYLNEDLQNAIDNKKISLNVAEHLSFLNETEQNMVCESIKDRKIKISEKQAKEMKEKSKEYMLSKDVLEEIINADKRDSTDKISIEFSKRELKKYIFNLEDKIQIKKIIIEALSKIKIG